MFRLTQNSEAASYVSDDIGVIGEAIAKGHVSGWVAKLLDLYHKVNFPVSFWRYGSAAENQPVNNKLAMSKKKSNSPTT